MRIQRLSNKEIGQVLAQRVKTIRKAQKITQKQLAQTSGVSYASYRLFEKNGTISLLSFIAAVRALGKLDHIDKLLEIDLFELENFFEEKQEQ